MESLFETALSYRRQELAVTVVDIHKKSLFYWKDFQKRMPSYYEISRMCNQPGAAGLAIVCGKISGGLEGIDVDTKYDLTGQLYHNLTQLITARNPLLFDELVINSTRSGGRHLLYRCQSPLPNSILARRPTTVQERVLQPKVKVKVLVETRGEKGYIIVPPTPGYRFLQNDLSKLPFVSGDQQEMMLSAGRSLNLWQESVNQKRPILPSGDRAAPEDSPMDDFDRRGDVIGLLERHGWKVIDSNSEKVILKRPGDSGQTSSGDYNFELGLFSTFSTSTEFQPMRGYKPCAVFAVLECGGNFSEAARRLLRMGYGKSRYGQDNNRQMATRKPPGTPTGRAGR